MRHLHLVIDHEPAPTDFPPTWAEYQAARQRYFARLAEAEVAGRTPAEHDPPAENGGRP